MGTLMISIIFALMVNEGIKFCAKFAEGCTTSGLLMSFNGILPASLFSYSRSFAEISLLKPLSHKKYPRSRKICNRDA